MRPLRDKLPRFTDRLPLGASGLEVSPYCLGCTGSADVVSAAFDLGINFFFVTADMHWPIYENIRSGLSELLVRRPEVRSQIVIGAVSYVTQREFCLAPFGEVLEAVGGLDSLDLLIAGGAYAAELSGREPVYRQHREHSFAGAKAIGASFHERAGAARAVRAEWLDIAFIRYNAAHPGAREDLFPELEPQRSTLVYNFKSTFGAVDSAHANELGLTDDHWIPEPVDHYRFVLSRPELDGVLFAPSTVAELEGVAAAIEEGPLSEEEEEHMLLLGELSRGLSVVQSDGRPTPTPGSTDRREER